MHMAIALRKHAVAWFGPTSAPEIDLYNRGVKLVSGCRVRLLVADLSGARALQRAGLAVRDREVESCRSSERTNHGGLIAQRRELLALVRVDNVYLLTLV